MIVCWWNVMVNQKKPQPAQWSWYNYSQSTVNAHCWYGGKWEGLGSVNIKNMYFLPRNVVASADINLNQKSRENRRNVLNTYSLSDRSEFEDNVIKHAVSFVSLYIFKFKLAWRRRAAEVALYFKLELVGAGNLPVGAWFASVLHVWRGKTSSISDSDSD